MISDIDKITITTQLHIEVVLGHNITNCHVASPPIPKKMCTLCAQFNSITFRPADAVLKMCKSTKKPENLLNKCQRIGTRTGVLQWPHRTEIEEKKISGVCRPRYKNTTFSSIQSLPMTMPPTRTGVNRTESRIPSYPLSPSSCPNEDFKNEDELDGNSEN